MVHVPKTERTYCWKAKKHTVHKISQYKKGNDSLVAQGKRRYLKINLRNRLPKSNDCLITHFCNIKYEADNHARLC